MRNVKQLAIAVALATLAVPASAQNLCNAAAHAWVKQNRENLPKSYKEIVSFPLNYRRAIYSALPAATRSKLWRTQLELALQREDLTNYQRSVLLEGVQLATSEIFDVARDPDHWSYRQMQEHLASFEQRVREAFAHEDALAIFAQLGPAERDDSTGGLRVQFEGLLAEEPACSCADQSDYCNSGFNCRQGGCIRIADECGTFWTYDCDGLCKTETVEVNTTQ